MERQKALQIVQTALIHQSPIKRSDAEAIGKLLSVIGLTTLYVQYGDEPRTPIGILGNGSDLQMGLLNSLSTFNKQLAKAVPDKQRLMLYYVNEDILSAMKQVPLKTEHNRSLFIMHLKDIIKVVGKFSQEVGIPPKAHESALKLGDLTNIILKDYVDPDPIYMISDSNIGTFDYTD